MNAAWYEVYIGNFETGERESEAVLDENPAYENAYVTLALSQLASGKLRSATQTYKKLASVSDRGSSMAAMGLADLALYDSRLEEAKDILESAIAKDLTANDSFAAANKLAVLGHVYAQMNQFAPAVKAVENALATEKSLAVIFHAATVYLMAAKPARAAELAENLGARTDSESQVHSALIRAELALGESHPRESVELLIAARRISDTWLGRLALGRAYIEVGAFAEASSELDACLRRKGEATALFLDDVPSFHIVPHVYFYLARSEEGLDSPGAANSYREFLRIKERGEETELVRDAKRRLSDLE